MNSIGNMTLNVYCDANGASCPNSRRSVTGYLVKFDGSLISWKSKKQTTVARSSAESEYRSMALTVFELIWLVGIFKELGIEISTPIQLHTDSKAAMQITNNLVFHERTKHIGIDCHFVREKVQQGLICPTYVPTEEQEVDLLTKGLGTAQHYHLMSKLGVLNIFTSPSLKGGVEIHT